MNQRVDLIRHGETPANNKPTIGGLNIHEPLSFQGFQQSRRLSVFALTPETKLLSSTATRAIRTAEYAYPGVPLVADDAFLEMSQGSLEGQLRSEAYTPEYLEAIEKEGWDHRAPGGQSLNEVADAMLEGIERHSADSNTLVIVSHTTAIRSLLGRIRKLDQEATILSQKIDFTHITRLIDYGKGFEIAFANLSPKEAAAYDTMH